MDILQFPANSILVITGIVSFVFGLIFILKPTILTRLSQSLNKNVFASERLQQALERERNSDPWFMNRGRLLGIVVILLTVVIVWQMRQYSDKSLPITVGVVGAILGLIFILKLTILTRLSQSLNKNVFNSNKLLYILEKDRDGDHWFVGHSRLVGRTFIILAVVMLLIAIII